MKLLVSATMIILACAGSLLIGQTSNFLSAGPALPTDTKGFSIVGDKVIIIRETGDMVVVSSSGSVVASLAANSIATGVLYYKTPPTKAILVDTFNVSTVTIDKNGTAYFSTLCPFRIIGDAPIPCALYKWDMKSPPVKILGRGDKILTSVGYLTVTAMPEIVTAGQDGSLLFAMNATKLVRRTETTTGPLYSIIHDTGATIGPFLLATRDGAIYFSQYKHTNLATLNGELMKLDKGSVRSLLPLLTTALWWPMLDFARNEVYAVAYNSVWEKYRQQVGFRVSPEPTENLLQTTNAGPMISNGLEFYLGLDSPWNGRDWLPVFDSLFMRDGQSKTWKKVLGINDTLDDAGRKITGIKLIIPFATHAFVLLNEGWYKLDPRFLPPPPPPPPPPTARIDSIKTLMYQTQSGLAPGGLGIIEGKQLTGFRTAGGTPLSPNIAESTPWPLRLAGTEVWISNRRAPLLYSNSTPDLSSVVIFQVPIDLAPQPAWSLQVKVYDDTEPIGKLVNESKPTSISIVHLAPVLSRDFNDPKFRVIMVNKGDGSGGRGLVGPNSPARVGDTIELWGTGFGLTSPVVPSGDIPTSLASVREPVKVFLRYKDDSYWQMETLYAVASPQFPGVYQIAFRVPPDVLAEDASLVLQVGDTFVESDEKNPDTFYLAK